MKIELIEGINALNMKAIRNYSDTMYEGLRHSFPLLREDELKEAINYSINQEIYLRKFLEDPDLPLDNNDAERSIKSFCVGKHSWHIIDSVKGAKSSALLYSIAESAKANSLKPYEYFCYLLKELVKHPRNNVPEEVLKALMPWSEEIPDHCRKTKSR